MRFKFLVFFVFFLFSGCQIFFSEGPTTLPNLPEVSVDVLKKDESRIFFTKDLKGFIAVSYTHLTLPTILLV